MSKINMSFFNAYLELDKVCAQMLDIKRGGVSAYINRLVELRFAPDRNEVLPKLLRYRKLRNVIAHEENAFADLSEITKADVKWLIRFSKSITRRTDPVSKYERKSRIFSVWKKLRIILIILAALAISLVGYFVLRFIGII